MMEIILRILGIVVGMGFISASVWMLLNPIGPDGWWHAIAKTINALLGAVFVLYGVLGRSRLKRVLPGAGRNIGG
jgi:hypothetical protein